MKKTSTKAVIKMWAVEVSCVCIWTHFTQVLAAMSSIKGHSVFNILSLDVN